MRITSIIYHRKRKGVSTILGTLIFIGILFTAVIPMYMVMNQADTKYQQKKLERERFDEERAREELYVIVYPTGVAAPDNITIAVENMCELTVKIVRIWINDTIHDQESIVKSMSPLMLGSFDVSPPEGINSSYDVRVTTDRGNVFESGSGPMVYDGWDWAVETKLINVLISSSGIVFKIYVTGPNDYDEYAQVWKIGGTAMKTFDITENGNGVYHVTVKRGSKIIHEEDVTMEWPDVHQ